MSQESEPVKYRTIYQANAEDRKLAKIENPSKRDVIRDHIEDLILKKEFQRASFTDLSEYLSSLLSEDFSAKEIQVVFSKIPKSKIKSIVANAFLRRATEMNSYRIEMLFSNMNKAREFEEEINKTTQNKESKLKTLNDIVIASSKELDRILESVKTSTLKQIDDESYEEISELVNKFKDEMPQ